METEDVTILKEKARWVAIKAFGAIALGNWHMSSIT
jgi:hypothetical protein